MKIKSTATIGKAGQGFRWTASIDANENATQRLAEFGIIYLMQRNSEVDGILGITRKEKNADGKLVTVRTGEKRGDVSYSEEIAEKLATTLSEANIGDDVVLGFQTVVTPYEGEQAGPAWKSKVKVIEGLRGTVLNNAQTEEAIDQILREAKISREEAGL